MRLAEFAWALMEPEEGRFDFSWLDDAIAVLAARGISVILGTPTAVMPAWMARKYPETLAMKSNGQRTTWGVRKNNCFTSGAYRLFSERITRAMAEHYAEHPQVIGWQTDNEFGNNPCSCPTCRTDFHDYVRARYRTLDALNDAWGTRFWGHLYREWAEIPIPDDQGSHNPGLLLDWQRYGSGLNVRFQRDQVNILRQRCPRHTITHNLMGYHHDLDYYDLAEDLDVVSWDNYPVWGKPEFPYDAAGAADLMRGLKRKNFWIMEQTAGPGGWGDFGRNVRPGELRKIAYQQVAHGADAMIWFRWRTCTVGREQYWHGLLGHDGVPGRRYREAAETAKELTAMWPLLEGTTVKAKIAIIYDYESIWATRFQKSFPDNSWHLHLRLFQGALLRAGHNCDYVRPGQDLSGYQVVVAPQLYLLPDALARQLGSFVERGGVLVTGLRTAVKDEHSRCHARTLPGLLSAALGIRIDEYESIATGASYPVTGSGPVAGSFTGEGFADWILPTTAEPLARYGMRHLEGLCRRHLQPARQGLGLLRRHQLQGGSLLRRLPARCLREGRPGAGARTAHWGGGLGARGERAPPALPHEPPRDRQRGRRATRRHRRDRRHPGRQGRAACLRRVGAAPAELTSEEGPAGDGFSWRRGRDRARLRQQAGRLAAPAGSHAAAHS